MTDLNSTKFKHLTLENRIEIQMCLDRRAESSSPAITAK